VAGDSTSIADRMSIGAGPFTYCRRVLGTGAATPSLRGRRLIGGFRGRAGSTGSTTLSQTPTCSGELIEVRLAQVEFVAGRAVVHSNRRYGVGAVAVKIAGKHDTCCLSHDTSVLRYTSDRLLAQIRSSNDRSRSPRRGSGASDSARHDSPRIAKNPHVAAAGGSRRSGPLRRRRSLVGGGDRAGHRAGDRVHRSRPRRTPAAGRRKPQALQRWRSPR
jgi:hypothetical protein